MQREKWIEQNNVYNIVMGIVREAYNAGYLEGKRDGSPIFNSDIDELDLERRKAECQ